MCLAALASVALPCINSCTLNQGYVQLVYNVLPNCILKWAGNSLRTVEIEQVNDQCQTINSECSTFFDYLYGFNFLTICF